MQLTKGDIKARKAELQQVIKELVETKQYYIYYEPEDLFERGEDENGMELLFPDLILIITPFMRKMYLEQTRQSVGVDFTYGMIRERPVPIDGRKEEYLVAAVAGFSNSRRTGCYAIAVASRENTDVVYTIMKKFIEHCGRSPDSFVTDQAPCMIAAGKRLKEEGYIATDSLLDTFHILRTYRFKNQKLKRLMRTMIRE